MVGDILCIHQSGTRSIGENLSYIAASQEAAMDPDDIALALAEALPRNAKRRDELIAVGMVATALIVGTVEEDRAELVEHFCETLRRSVALELN